MTTPDDRAAKKAEELISARCLAAPQYLHGERDAVAAELRKAYDEIASLRAEVQHWREAAASVGQPDGHGWAEETKALRAKLISLDVEEGYPDDCLRAELERDKLRIAKLRRDSYRR